MALRPCPHCKASISRSAASCPSCGYVPWVPRLRKFCFALAAISYGMVTLASTPAPAADDPFFKLGVLGLMVSGLVLSALVWK